MSSPQSSLQSPSVVQEIPTPQDQEIDDVISYLSGEYEEQSQSKHTQMPTSSSVMTVKQDGGAGSSTSMLGEDQSEPVQFADLIRSFQPKERSAGCGVPIDLTSSFPVAVRSGGPAPSAPFASLTSSFLATEGSGGPDPIMDPTAFLGTELDSKLYQISPCVMTTPSLIQPEQSTPFASWKQPEKEHLKVHLKQQGSGLLMRLWRKISICGSQLL